MLCSDDTLSVSHCTALLITTKRTATVRVGQPRVHCRPSLAGRRAGQLHSADGHPPGWLTARPAGSTTPTTTTAAAAWAVYNAMTDCCNNALTDRWTNHTHTHTQRERERDTHLLHAVKSQQQQHTMTTARLRSDPLPSSSRSSPGYLPWLAVAYWNVRIRNSISNFPLHLFKLSSRSQKMYTGSTATWQYRRSSSTHTSVKYTQLYVQWCDSITQCSVLLPIDA